MYKRLFLWLVAALCIAASASAAGKRFTLVIDAGHGGKDGGARGAFSNEKDINLSVALAFGHYVEKNCADVKVIYTRKTDVFIPLHQRAEIANKNKADIFISIHTNSVESKRPVRGMETYTMGLRRSDEKLSAAQRENDVILQEKDYKEHYAGYDPRSPESIVMFGLIHENNMKESIDLARLIQQHVCAASGRPNKGVRQDVFLVLRETAMPACLVELGYITTPDEERALNNKTTVDAMGRGLYKALVAYRKQIGTGGNAAPAAQPAEKKPAEKPAAEKPAEKKPAEKPAAEKPAEKPDSVAQAPAEKPAPQNTDTPEEQPQEQPVFKVQILASTELLKDGNPQFKGLKDVDHYQEGKLYKYTVGASTNYNEVNQLRRNVSTKFPGAFVIAFRGSEKMDVNEAIREFRANRNKK